jgi:selenocysteine-specific elongation factor
VVLDPLAPSLRRGRPETAAALDRLERGTLEERVALWVEQAREAGAAEDALAARAGVPAEAIRAAAGVAVARGELHALRRSPDRWISESALARLASRAIDEMARLLAGGGSVGVPRRTLLARLLPDGSDSKWAEAVEAALVARGIYTIAGEEARPPGRDDLAGADRQLSSRILEEYRRRGLDPPSLPDVTREIGHKAKVIEGLAGYLVKRGDLVRLPGGWLIAKDAVDGVVAKLKDSGKTSLDVGEFKEMFSLTRRLAIPLLEYLDGAKFTRRVGDRREIVR